jgi:hypothetical protein
MSRADRVRQIAEGNFGKVLESSSDSMTVEVATDLAMGLPWGQAGLVQISGRCITAATLRKPC